MSEDTISQLPDPSGFGPDPFTEVLRDGARKLIEQAIHAELTTLTAAFSGDKLDDGRARLVRHGHLPEREVMTGIGPVQVKVPRVRDRRPGEDRITFTPSILPRYLRRAKSVDRAIVFGAAIGGEDDHRLAQPVAQALQAVHGDGIELERAGATAGDLGGGEVRPAPDEERY